MVIRWDDDPFCNCGFLEPQFITVSTTKKDQADELSAILQRKPSSDPVQTPMSIELREQINRVKEERGECHPDVTLVLMEAAKSCNENGDDDQAMEFYREALQLQMGRNVGHEHEIAGDILSGMASLMKTKVCLIKSVEYYDAALGNYELAMNAFDSMRVDERVGLRCKIVSTLNNIGNIKFEQRKFEEAKATYHCAMKIARRAIHEAEESAGNESESIEVSMDCDNVSAVSTCSTSTNEKINRLLHHAQLQNADTLNNIASVHGERSEWAEAIQFYNKALNIQMEQLGEDDPVVANTLNNIGTMNFRYGNLLVALKSYKQVAKMRKNTLGSCIQLSDALVNVAQVHEKGGNDEQAEKMYTSALRVAIDNVGERHVKVATIMMAIGEMQVRRGSDDLALQYLSDAWTTFKSVGLDDEHFLVKAVTKSIGDLRYKNQDDLGTTMSVFYEAINLLSQEGLAAFSVNEDLKVNSFVENLSEAELNVTQAAF